MLVNFRDQYLKGIIDKKQYEYNKKENRGMKYFLRKLDKENLKKAFDSRIKASRKKYTKHKKYMTCSKCKGYNIAVDVMNESVYIYCYDCKGEGVTTLANRWYVDCCNSYKFSD